MAINTWSGVVMSASNQFGTAETLTAVTQANPAVATTSGTAPTNGDWVFTSLQGMSKANGLLVRAQSVAGNDFQLEGVDSTLYNPFTSGTYQPAPRDVTFNTITGVSVTGGDGNTVDITTIHDLAEKTIAGATTAISISMDSHWNPADLGLQAAKRISDNRLQTGIVLEWPSGDTAAFAGSISASLFPTGNAQDVVTTPLTITVSGNLTIYYV